jgi:mannose-1-phosphate guanylyltransferase
MKIVIFAGGTGRRLWPISRKRSPKQFEPIIGEHSTLQLAVERLRSTYGVENIYISTNEQYADIIRRQLPELSAENVIGEPVRRDLAAAVGLALLHVSQTAEPDEPLAILWGDNYMDDSQTFLNVLAAAEALLRQQDAQIVFIGESPRFANENLGWISLGEQAGEVAGRPYYTFASWVYRPPLDECQRLFEGGSAVWNTGYFVTTPRFIRQMYEQHQPDMWQQLRQIELCIGRADYQETLQRLYPLLASLHFDDAIAKHIARDDARVLHGRMGWSDPGSLYALKEAINPDPEANVELGRVHAHQSKDSLLYNYEPDKLLVAVGLEGMIVVNTPDAILVVHKDHIPLVKQMVDGLEGTELEQYS